MQSFSRTIFTFGMSTCCLIAVTAQVALINFQSAVSPAPGAPSYASDLSGSIDAVWDNTAESFVSFDMVVSGFPTVLEFTSDHHFFIESPFTKSGSYAMPIVELASVATPCCGLFFDSISGILYLHFDRYSLATSPGLDPNDFADVAIALNALNFGNVDFALYNFFNAPGGMGTGASPALTWTRLSAQFFRSACTSAGRTQLQI